MGHCRTGLPLLFSLFLSCLFKAPCIRFRRPKPIDQSTFQII
jgi:hypothetical protein